MDYTQDKHHYLKVNPADPNSIPKFVDSLPIPEIALPKNFYDCDDNATPFYDISMEELYHRFHRYFPSAEIWGYNGMYPGPTFEVMKDTHIRVKWTNKLPKKHFLPIDHTLDGTIDTPDVRTVVHLHGANVASDSDGNPDAWFTQDYSIIGSSFTHEVYNYTNHQPGTTLWYHDHTLGITRLNVYAGLAGFYLIRDNLEKRLNLPSGNYEIPIMIQDRSFNSDGSLFYPSEPNPPVSVSPSVIGGFFGNTIVVNGKVWPYLNVEPRKYRFRLLNACNTRPLDLTLSNNGDFYQIGTDGGMLHHTNKLSEFTLEPAERIDLIIDFSKYNGQEITLMNSAFNSDVNTSNIMRFNVNIPLSSPDTSTIPEMLSPKMHINKNLATVTRNLPLSQSTDEFNRPLFLLDNKMWTDPATETPKLDSIEVWNIINTFPFSHPIHVHLVQFMIIDRRPYDVRLYNSTGRIRYTGPPEKPLPYETGFKDTVRADGGKITRIVMHFKEHPGDFVWHCHVLEHEDHDMMRPIRILNN